MKCLHPRQLRNTVIKIPFFFQRGLHSEKRVTPTQTNLFREEIKHLTAFQKTIVGRQTYLPSGILQMPLFPIAHGGAHRVHPSRAERVLLLYCNEDQQVCDVVSSSAHHQPGLRAGYRVNARQLICSESIHQKKMLMENKRYKQWFFISPQNGSTKPQRIHHYPSYEYTGTSMITLTNSC